MVYQDDMYLIHSIINTVKELLGIDINNSEYSETCYGFENLKSYLDDNDNYHKLANGVIGITKKGFLLCWLHFDYEYNEQTNSTNCTIKIKELFPEHLKMFGIKNLTLD